MQSGVHDRLLVLIVVGIFCFPSVIAAQITGNFVVENSSPEIEKVRFSYSALEFSQEAVIRAYSSRTVYVRVSVQDKNEDVQTVQLAILNGTENMLQFFLVSNDDFWVGTFNQEFAPGDYDVQLILEDRESVTTASSTLTVVKQRNLLTGAVIGVLGGDSKSVLWKVLSLLRF